MRQRHSGSAQNRNTHRYYSAGQPTGALAAVKSDLGLTTGPSGQEIPDLRIER
jgi:hypothetical protein